jgi:regulator of cell morphogenesis and NO signaling
MRITDVLLGEHGVFYAQFDYLQHAVRSAGNVAEVQSLAGMLDAALASHAAMENSLLFSALEPHLGAQSGPLSVMRWEHDEIERIFNQLAQARSLKEAQQLVADVLQVARAHFVKEEQMLFPAAERTLGAATLADLGTRWAAQRGVIPEAAYGL